MARESWSWDQINQVLAELSPAETDCALAWLADQNPDNVRTAVEYAKDRCR